MTAHQTAVAAAADLKWLTNSAALLRRPLRYEAGQAKWWGLVRVLVDALGLALTTAATIATSVLGELTSGTPMREAHITAGLASIVIDLPRYESIFLGNLSRALVLETPRRRGRTGASKGGVEAAREYGIDIGLLKSALERSPADRLATLDANAELSRGMRRAAR
ncbi:MAG: hypothetical protein ACR2NS_14150 [Gemmatimonadaceae bacterium]